MQKAWWKCEPGLESTTRPVNKDGRFEANDLAFERNTLSATNGLELMDGGNDSPRGCRGRKRLPCIDLEREEYLRDEWLVLDLCGSCHCDPDGVVRPEKRPKSNHSSWVRPCFRHKSFLKLFFQFSFFFTLSSFFQCFPFFVRWCCVVSFFFGWFCFGEGR